MEREQISILLVEDNPGDARLIREALREVQSHELILQHVSRLSDALQCLADDNYGVVLLDLSLPDAHGLDTVRQAHSAAPDIPIVVLTGLNDEVLAVKSVQAGAQDYLVKGQIDGNLLVRAMRYAIERNRMRAALVSLSLIDDLTGLYNRRGFMSLADRHMKLSHRRRKGFLFVFADVDCLKQINDNLGHQEGDRTLMETAEVFRETFRASDIIARLGGDEFAALPIDACENAKELFIQRLEGHLRSHNELVGRRSILSLSVGTAFCRVEDPCCLEELIAEADASMYQEKKRKKQMHPHFSVLATSPFASGPASAPSAIRGDSIRSAGRLPR
jgi:two-component system, cell cycle response regulator